MRAAWPCMGALFLLLLPSSAFAWELFRAESSAIERGNEALAKGQHQEALEAYDEAARELPNDPGVQLDRGLALMGLDKLGEAREAFRRAASASAPREIRGPALYDLGLAFMKEADMAGEAQDLDGAHKLLQEAVDAFRGSLRAQPSNPDAAWNLELARRRLVDNDQKREQKKKEEEEKKKEEQQKQDQEKQDPQDGGDPQQQPDAGSPEQGDAGSPEPSDQDSEQPEPGDDAGAPQPPPAPEDEGDAGAPQQPEPEPQQPQEPQQQEAQSPNELPEHMQRALDALEAGEENLEKQRAKQRARSRPRRIDKDW